MKTKRQMSMIVVSVALAFAVGVAHEVEAAPGAGTLFGTDASGGNLITVDPFTGVGVVVGPMGAGAVPALAVDPTTGVLYAGQGAGASNLYTVDPATGAATLVGGTGLGFAAIGGMDFRADGTLFAAVNIAGDGGTGSDHLATIDQATGAATVIGPFGTCIGVTIPTFGGGSCTIEGIEAIAFDTAGTLWGALSARGAAGAPGLYTINPATGAATFVAPIEDLSGSPPSGGVVSLQFACDGTLYGGTATGIFPATDGGRLITIDPATGLFTFVGLVSATGGNSLGALAFQDACIISVEIDIKPGGFPNSINPRSKGVIPVAILTTATFDATTVDPLSVTFGPNGAVEAHGRGHIEDVDGDGDLDLVLHFRTQDTGIVCGDTSASLTGETFSGQTINGTDSIRTVGCK